MNLKHTRTENTQFNANVHALPPEGNTVVFEDHRNSVGSEVCEVCLVGRTERGRQRRRGRGRMCVGENKH